MEESLSPLAHRCKQKVQKIRLKCQAGQGMLDPSLEKECEGEGKKREWGILQHLRRWGEMVWQVPGPSVPVGPRSYGMTAEAQALKCTQHMS